MAKNTIKIMKWRLQEIIIMPFFGIVPRFMFGNNAGVMSNVIAKLELLFKRRKKLTLPTDDLRQKTIKLKTHGIYTFEHPKKALLLKIRDKIELLEKDPNIVIPTGSKYFSEAQRMVQEPFKHIPELLEVLQDCEALPVLRAHYGTGCKITACRVYVNSHIEGMEGFKKEVFSNQWHNDQNNTNMMKFFIYLSDNVDESSGAFTYVDKQDTKRVMRAFGYFRRTHIYAKAKQLIEQHTRFLTGSLGDCALVSVPCILHKASIPKKGKTRTVIQFTVYPAKHELIYTENLNALG